MTNVHAHQSLIVIYDPDDLQWATKISTDLRQKHDYTNEITLKPLIGSILDRKQIIANQAIINSIDIYNHLLNESEVTGILYNEENFPIFPEHSIFLVEYDDTSHQIIRSVWASNKYFDDVGTFTSRRMRKAQFAEIMAQLANMPVPDPEIELENHYTDNPMLND